MQAEMEEVDKQGQTMSKETKLIVYRKEISLEAKDDLTKITDRYADTFQEKLTSFSKGNLVEHSIELLPGVQPVCKPVFRMSPKELDCLKEEIKTLEKAGFIVPSKSPWGSPVLFAKKKDGSLRMCVDYRELNKLTIQNKYPPPRIDAIFDRLQGAKYFSKLDLTSGYHQVPMKAEDVEKTAFRTHYDSYEFRVMPFGLTNAPATFQAMMNDVLKDYLDKCIVVYLDDILIFSKTEEQHLRDIESVLKVLKDASLKAKKSKCVFFAEKILFLGHVISQEGISVDKDKVKAISDWPAPKCVQEVQSLLGLTGYYRKFIPAYASIAKPITDLLRKDVVFRWSARQDAAFELLKQALTSGPLLRLPDFSKPFIVTTDASGLAIGGVLSQEFDGRELPLCFESRTLTVAERNYPTHELEGLAILHCFKKWRCYLEGSQSVVRTDHFSLKFLFSQKSPSRRVMRWIQFLSSFDMKIESIKGTDNVAADALSRQQQPLLSNAIVESDWPEVIPNCQHDVPLPTDLSEKVRKQIMEEKENFVFENEVLYRLVDDKKVPFVPFAFRADLVSKFHHSNGHLGLQGTFELMKTRYWWPRMKTDLRNWLKSCVPCQVGARPDHSPKEPLHPLPVQFIEPFSRWGIDFIGILPRTSDGNRFIITAVDYCTKWPLAKAVTNATAEVVTKFIEEEIIAAFGIPDEIISDRGTAFNSSLVEQYLENARVKHIMTSAFHPRTNGVTERFNGVLGNMIKKHINIRRDDWDKHIANALLASRVRLHHATGYSPFYLVYGRNARIPGDIVLPNIDNEDADHVGNRLNEITAGRKRIQQAKEKLEEQRKKMIDNSNSSRGESIELGSQVLLRNESAKKWQPGWYGPFTVSGVHAHGVFSLNFPNGAPYWSRVHRDRLRPAVIKNDTSQTASLKCFKKQGWKYPPRKKALQEGENVMN